MICLHPNTTEPKRWRVQSKTLNEQKYFSFIEYGSQSSALAAAKAYSEKLNERKRFKHLRLDLDVNRLFNENGHVRGLSLFKSKNQWVLKAQCTKNHKQISTSRSLKNKTLRDAFDEVCEWIIKTKEIDCTKSIQRELFKSYCLFESLNSDKIQAVRSEQLIK